MKVLHLPLLTNGKDIGINNFQMTETGIPSKSFNYTWTTYKYSGTIITSEDSFFRELLWSRNFTISCFIDNPIELGVQLGKINGSPYGFSISFSIDGNRTFMDVNYGDSFVSFTTGKLTYKNHFCISVKDGIATGYINGQYVGEFEPNIYPQRLNAGNALKIDNDDGHIYNVEIFDEALSAHRIQDISKFLYVHLPLDTYSKYGDCSGFLHSTSASQTAWWATDMSTPIHETSADLEDMWISCKFLQPIYDEFTINFWVYLTGNSQWIVTPSSDASLEADGVYVTRNYVHYRAFDINFTSPLQNKQWYMITLVMSENIEKVYINGQLENFASVEGYSFEMDQFYLNCEQSTIEMSNFRIYLTALKNNDIIDLYNGTRQKIDSKGDIFAYTFGESSNYIDKRGVISALGFTEDKDKIGLSKNNIDCKELIEI